MSYIVFHLKLKILRVNCLDSEVNQIRYDRLAIDRHRWWPRIGVHVLVRNERKDSWQEREHRKWTA